MTSEHEAKEHLARRFWFGVDYAGTSTKEFEPSPRPLPPPRPLPLSPTLERMLSVLSYPVDWETAAIERMQTGESAEPRIEP